MKKSKDPEELEIRESVAPKGTMLCIISATIPAYAREWIDNESSRREIPTAWVVAELIRDGIESAENKRLEIEMTE